MIASKKITIPTNEEAKTITSVSTLLAAVSMVLVIVVVVVVIVVVSILVIVCCVLPLLVTVDCRIVVISESSDEYKVVRIDILISFDDVIGIIDDVMFCIVDNVVGVVVTVVDNEITP